MLTTHSVYAKGPKIAIATFDKESSRVIPRAAWISEKEPYRFIDEMKRIHKEGDHIVVSPDEFASEPSDSFLQRMLRGEGFLFCIDIAPRLNLAEGLATCGQMKQYGDLDMNKFPMAERIEAELMAPEFIHSVEAHAFIQGLIFTKTYISTDWMLAL